MESTEPVNNSKSQVGNISDDKNIDNSYVLKNIVWYNPKQPSILKRQISESSTHKNSNDMSQNITVAELMDFLEKN